MGQPFLILTRCVAKLIIGQKRIPCEFDLMEKLDQVVRWTMFLREEFWSRKHVKNR